MPKNNNKIPERWEDYTGVGTFIPGTRFIPFKTPLKEILAAKVEDKFTPENLVRRLETKELELGHVIDLTFTNRYYDPQQEFEDRGILHTKIKTQGKKVPRNEVVYSFAAIVNDFVKENWGNDLLIGVHCTHGVNRTGYLICRYMIENLNYTAEEALKAFREGRGHELENEDYKDSLHSISKEISQGTNRYTFEKEEDDNNYEQYFHDNMGRGNHPAHYVGDRGRHTDYRSSVQEQSRPPPVLYEKDPYWTSDDGPGIYPNHDPKFGTERSRPDHHKRAFHPYHREPMPPRGREFQPMRVRGGMMDAMPPPPAPPFVPWGERRKRPPVRNYTPF